MTLTGTGAIGDPYVISADPIVSGTAGNQLTCTPSGLFVPAGSVTIVAASDTPCMDVTVTQFPIGTYTVSVVPIIDPVAGNQLVCGPAGLSVPSAASTNVVAVDTITVNNTVTQAPVGTFNVQSDVIVSPDAGNQLVAQANGLFVKDCQTPVGAIVMWMGATAPAGWAICDGTSGTPDLRDLVPVGAGGLYGLNSTGGSATGTGSHSHTLSSHTHTGSGTVSTENTLHVHTFATGGASNDHAHNEGIAGNHDHTINGGNGFVWAFRLAGSVEGLQTGSTGTRATFSNMAANGDHTHPIFGATADHSHSGTTSGENVLHDHTFTFTSDGPDTDATSTVGTADGNLQPYRAVNFIMKITAC